ncbi:hypothetical protein [Mycolicibacterium tokaiense]|uniref:hypothetical protein n=1 Tax=Mycolicibacterium tokaiense TaxID=39695 RepID=UPI0011C06181|nr:hypothetical protein [Mycolicibacterium tokaiense]
MRTRIAAGVLLVGMAVAGALGTAGIAGAKHGADDPVGHVRHSQGADDLIVGHHHRGRGGDDRPGHH